MQKVSYTFLFLAALLILPLLIQNNHHARKLRLDISRHEALIKEEKEKLTLLKLEMNTLTHPARIARLSRERLPHLRIAKKDQIYVFSREKKEERLYNLSRTIPLSFTSGEAFTSGEGK
jgi:cell division protein FtsL